MKAADEREKAAIERERAGEQRLRRAEERLAREEAKAIDAKTKKDKRTQILVIPNKIKGASANKIATAKLEAFQSTSRDNSLSIFQYKVVWNLRD